MGMGLPQLLLSVAIFWQLYASTWAPIDFAMQLGNPFILCPKGATENSSFVCDDGSKHYFCVETVLNRKKCKKFKLLRLSSSLRDIFVNSHNGLRNKIAHKYNIANMQLVYWSPELELMALLFLRKCEVGMDPCAVIGSMKYEVGQTYSYGRPKKTNIWPGYVVRSWYLEMGTEFASPNEFHTRYIDEHTDWPNFTQISWPPLEFFGCASALMFSSQYIVCFYYPKANPEIEEDGLLQGPPCSQCIQRKVCSTIYDSLCGLDMENKSVRLDQQHIYAPLGCMVVWALIAKLG